MAPGGSYTLTATYYNDVGQLVKYNGKLNYQLRFCQLNNSSSCQTSTGAWGDYTLNNGQVVISLPSNTAQGIYNASFMPVGLSGFNWSNEAKSNAAVYVVIIGFASFDITNKKIFEYENINEEPFEKEAKNINPYLVDSNDFFIEKFFF